jgi:hypothetical protein
VGCDEEVLREEAFVVKRFGKQRTNVGSSNIKEPRELNTSSDNQTFQLGIKNSTAKLDDLSTS